MTPDTSCWRDSGVYDALDDMTPDELAWEFLRRNRSYQSYYHGLVMNGAQSDRLPHEEERRWGLRFRGPARAFRDGAAGALVAFDQSRDRYLGTSAPGYWHCAR